MIFSRKQIVQLVVIDINAVVKDLDKMLRRLIDEHVEITILPGADLGRVKADSGYVGQLVMNLVVNARDAIPTGPGHHRHQQCHARRCLRARASGRKAGRYVMLSVSDSGTGMTDKVKARLFEAFFTTKPKGKGTGLGLATCHTIMQQSGGHIAVQSELGKGTNFKIYFPRVDQPLDGAALPQIGSVPRGTETLLVVEDQPSLRLLAQCVLQAQGYHVLTASNGEEALRSVRNHKATPIRLVISDVIMPQMGGRVMAEWLKISQPRSQGSLHFGIYG